MFGHKRFRFRVSISAEDLLEIYKGSFRRVRVRTDEGLVLEVDADRFKDFTTRSGIHGYFQLTVTQDNHFVKLDQLF